MRQIIIQIEELPDKTLRTFVFNTGNETTVENEERVGNVIARAISDMLVPTAKRAIYALSKEDALQQLATQEGIADDIAKAGEDESQSPTR